MAQKSFDDPALRACMAQYLATAVALDEAADLGAEPRDVLELAEAKAMAGMALRRRLGELGWSVSGPQHTSL
ncbi:MAG: hypothetical protein KY451_14970 [Actinobacteria bacterium]|nr:hypothetical protein [Actinomycetota bacterium]MBW3646847.1 hypothetical protein [Actinomycetota bacterium]